MKIAPSLLAADFANLHAQILDAEKGGADWIHLDIMDGHFVPNITFGPPLVKAIRKETKLPFDVHLMIEDPDRFITAFRSAGADILTVHQETCPHLFRTVQTIKESGAQAGVALNPATPVSALHDIIGEVDLILIMTVEPGFGGQRFIPGTVRKIEEVRDLALRANRNIFIEVDGGIDTATAKDVLRAGASVLVAGTSIFGMPSIREAISALRSAG